MLKSELFQLEKLIGEIVNYYEISDSEASLKEVGTKTAHLAGICEGLRLKWVRELFSSVKETIILRYVQYHQAGIISLSDVVYAEIPGLNENRYSQQLNNFYNETINQLEGLLQFLEKSFYKYYDFDHVVSAELCRRESENILNLLKEVISKLVRAGIDQRLIEGLKTAISEKIDNALQSGISYRQVSYLSGILNLIRARTLRGDFNTDVLAQLLYHQNFNSYYFERWYQSLLTSTIANASKKNKDIVIQKELETLQSRFVEHGKSFHHELPAINDSLIAWLGLQYIGIQQLSAKITGKMNGHDRMPLNFSVAQFGLFIRLCYLEGCFHVNNISGILRFFSFHFETKKQLNISLKSFRRAFYGGDQATAAVVRDYLQRMLNLIDKTYFPRT
ncbi:hypothetical protein KXD93_22085 [Mucilaginibacter sp. BJC16-A38]|uniref:hypothetical protein n=1 Tax=Mucilaginibacter phenanthrenivorans TaxID=1234842 RepID=UPI00215769A7|nr:hypothetical protein [Mucilaginibacter phenanthrenivorans]MCR8560359.1 hypothetical protein [Mucilaginibacter phenanthrenivorans]